MFILPSSPILEPLLYKFPSLMNNHAFFSILNSSNNFYWKVQQDILWCQSCQLDNNTSLMDLPFSFKNSQSYIKNFIQLTSLVTWKRGSVCILCMTPLSVILWLEHAKWLFLRYFILTIMTTQHTVNCSHTFKAFLKALFFCSQHNILFICSSST